MVKDHASQYTTSQVQMVIDGTAELDAILDERMVIHVAGKLQIPTYV
jgi:hypothetical protein